LLESPLDDQSALTVHRPGRTHLSEEELNYMFGLPMHPFADVCDIGEDGFLVTFAEDLWRGDGVPLARGGEEGGVRRVQGDIEALEELFSGDVNPAILQLCTM
jgi:hypothetical protein